MAGAGMPWSTWTGTTWWTRRGSRSFDGAGSNLNRQTQRQHGARGGKWSKRGGQGGRGGWGYISGVQLAASLSKLWTLRIEHLGISRNTHLAPCRNRTRAASTHPPLHVTGAVHLAGPERHQGRSTLPHRPNGSAPAAAVTTEPHGAAAVPKFCLLCSLAGRCARSSPGLARCTAPSAPPIRSPPAPASARQRPPAVGRAPGYDGV